MHAANLPGQDSRTFMERSVFGEENKSFSNEPTESWTALTQPRDIRHRRRSGTVVVASEGTDRLVEFASSVKGHLERPVDDHRAESNVGLRLQSPVTHPR